MAKEQIAQEPAVVTTTTAPEQVYALTELTANAAALFDVQPEVIAGALYNNQKQEFTIAELRAVIDAFLGKKVK